MITDTRHEPSAISSSLESIQERLTALVDGELGSRDADEARALAGTDPMVREELQETELLTQLMRSWVVAVAHIDLWARVSALTQSESDGNMHKASTGSASEPMLGKMLSEIERVKQEFARTNSAPTIDLRRHLPQRVALDVLPADVARTRQILPVKLDGSKLWIAVSSETSKNIDAIDAVRLASKCLVQPMIADENLLRQMIDDYYPTQSAISPRSSEAPLVPDTQESITDVVPEEFASYLTADASYPLLTLDQEKRLAEFIAGGSQWARTVLANTSLRLVVAIAKKYRNRGIEMSALLESGFAGLTAAIDNYDHKRGFRFSTYATHHIRQAMNRVINGEEISGVPAEQSGVGLPEQDESVSPRSDLAVAVRQHPAIVTMSADFTPTPQTRSAAPPRPPRPPISVATDMAPEPDNTNQLILATLAELRAVRDEVSALRQELAALRRERDATPASRPITTTPTRLFPLAPPEFGQRRH